MAGYFITFEGGEGSGKTTQINAVSKTLAELGHEVLITREPGGTKAGEAIREIFLSNHLGDDTVSEALLVTAARRQHLLRVVLPSLADNKIILCDRYTDSTYVYQGALGGLSQNWLQNLQQLSLPAVSIAMTFLLDLPVQSAMQRVEKRQGEAANRYDVSSKDSYSHIRDAFLARQKQYSDRMHLIDASQSTENVTSDILQRLQTILKLKV